MIQSTFDGCSLTFKQIGVKCPGKCVLVESILRYCFFTVYKLHTSDGAVRGARYFFHGYLGVLSCCKETAVTHAICVTPLTINAVHHFVLARTFTSTSWHLYACDPWDFKS